MKTFTVLTVVSTAALTIIGVAANAVPEAGNYDFNCTVDSANNPCSRRDSQWPAWVSQIRAR